MNNETQPTPEQLAKWREEAVRFYINSPIDHEYLGHSDYYITGYLRAKQENEQVMKLAKFGAEVANHVDGMGAVSSVVLWRIAKKVGVLTEDETEYAQNIGTAIEELLK